MRSGECNGVCSGAGRGEMGEIGISRSCLNRKVAYMQDSKGGYFNWSKRGTWSCCADGHYFVFIFIERWECCADV